MVFQKGYEAGGVGVMVGRSSLEKSWMYEANGGCLSHGGCCAAN